MNQDSWQGMDDEDRDIIASAVDDVINKQFAEAEAEDEKWIQTAQNDGMEYIVPSDEEMAAWIERVRSSVWVEAEATLGEDIMDAVRSHASTPN